MIFRNQHMKLDTFAKLLLNDGLQFFFGFGIIRIKPSKRSLKLHIENRLASLSVVFWHGLQKCLFESSCRLSDNHLPACHDLLQIFRCCFLWWPLYRFWLFSTAFSHTCTLHDHRLRRALVNLLFEYTDTVQHRIQIRLHCRAAQFDQRNLNKHALLCCEADLIGKI